MSRLDYFTIAIVAVCILAILFLLYRTTDFFKKDNPATEQNITRNFEGNEDGFSDEVIDPADYEDYSLDEEEGTAQEGAENERASKYPEEENVIVDAGASTSSPDEMTYDYEEEAEPASDNTTNTSPSADYSPAGSAGEYLVLAGSFEFKHNAENYARKLRNMGFDEAQVAPFNRGKYAAVLVNRFEDYDRAEELAQQLKDQSIEAIVMRKR